MLDDLFLTGICSFLWNWETKYTWGLWQWLLMNLKMFLSEISKCHWKESYFKIWESGQSEALLISCFHFESESKKKYSKYLANYNKFIKNIPSYFSLIKIQNKLNLKMTEKFIQHTSLSNSVIMFSILETGTCGLVDDTWLIHIRFIYNILVWSKRLLYRLFQWPSDANFFSTDQIKLSSKNSFFSRFSQDRLNQRIKNSFGQN